MTDEHMPGERRSSRHRPRRRKNLSIASIATVTVALAIVSGVGIALVLASTRPQAVSSPAVVSPVVVSEPVTETAPLTEPELAAEPIPEPPISFDSANALADVRSLETYGVRKGGTQQEANAADWLRRRMTEMGYAASIEEIPLPNGATTRNVVARAEGASARVMVLGAHMDTKAPSTGANDNGSGCGALLELARIIASQPVTPTVEFVFFGTEEMIDKDGSHHHYGSRYRVNAMSSNERANTAGMISVDMIGFGPDFHSRTMLRGPQSMSDYVLSKASESGLKMTFLKDKGSTGWSDHEAYELAGIPATWIEWRDDPVYHTAKDTSAHLDSEKIRVAGQLVLDVLRSLDDAALERLAAR